MLQLQARADLSRGMPPCTWGVELEVDDGGKDPVKAKKILSIFNQTGEFGYIKSDGSLDDGLELVTHPCTLEAHMREVPWREALEKFKALGYYSHQSSTCGLHVHVNRTFFGTAQAEQDEKIGHVLYLFERFWQELLRFSRRTAAGGSMGRKIRIQGYRARDHGACQESIPGRYTCVNLTNTDTIEFRIFRGTLKYNTLIATLQLVEKLCNVAVSLSEERLQALSWSDIMLGIEPQRYPELVQYLKELRLYINAPVSVECEV